MHSKLSLDQVAHCILALQIILQYFDELTLTAYLETLPPEHVAVIDRALDAIIQIKENPIVRQTQINADR